MNDKTKDKGLVIFVSTPYSASNANILCPGVILLASILKNAGYRIKIFNGSSDADYQEKLWNALNNEKPLYIGFSVMTTQVPASYALTKKIKSAMPDIKIVWGGFHAIIFPNEIIADENIDIVAFSEAINTITPLTEAFTGERDFATVPGIFYKMNGEIRQTEKPGLAGFDEIPDMDWDVVDRETLEKYINRVDLGGQPERALEVLTGLGCQFKCAFCHNTIFGHKHRTMNAERIVANLKSLKEKYQINRVWLSDEHFFGDRKRLAEFIELMEKENLNLRIWANIRASDVSHKFVTPEILARLKGIGFYTLAMGAESGSMEMLKKIRKGITVEQIKNACASISNAGIHASASFILGMPGENVKDYFDTVKLIIELRNANPEMHVIFQLFRPYPGSSFYDRAMEAGLKVPKTLQEWVDYYRVFANEINPLDSMPWADDVKLLDRIVMAYMTQNIKFKFVSLQNVKIPFIPWNARINLSFIKYIFNFFYHPLALLERSRIRNEYMNHMVEMPLLRLINKTYFHA